MSIDKGTLRQSWEKYAELRQRKQDIEMALIDHQIDVVNVLVEMKAFDLFSVNWSRLRRIALR